LAWLLLFSLGATAAALEPPTTPRDSARVEAPGLHNVFHLSDRLYSGSSPDGAEGFASLRRLGVRTVLSVDGARPDVALAHAYGLRYVHLPIGYDGVPREQALRIARAVRDLPGPVYIHCHHGKHRGPAAAAVAHLWLDPTCTVESALAELRRAGTDPHYTGLYAAPRELGRPAPGELERVPADFPEAVSIGGLAAHMVEIDERWERIRLIRAAGWRRPSDHPDLDPPHEVLQLVEHYREAGRTEDAGRRPAELRGWLSEAERSAAALEEILRRGSFDPAVADRLFHTAGAACTHCHAKYRDVRH
jgi:protein tyrosine phosphatase (PTP) superfamily phosphohydrolase (DUF442 family)